jgi:hypothetical protein
MDVADPDLSDDLLMAFGMTSFKPVSFPVH